MGIQDTATITLTCPQCGRTETSRVHDYGSGWGPDNWQRPTFQAFDATIIGGGIADPAVTGTCPACNTAATVTKQYGS